jgi:hypothetical protein
MLFDYYLNPLSIKVIKEVFLKLPFIYEMVNCVQEMVNYHFFVVKKMEKMGKLPFFRLCFLSYMIYL